MRSLLWPGRKPPTDGPADEVTKIKDLYHDWAPLYDRHMEETGHYAAIYALLNNVSRYLGVDVMLDITCGTGVAMDYIMNRAQWEHDRYPRVIIANDFSEDMLRYAKQKAGLDLFQRILARVNGALNFARGTYLDDPLRHIDSRDQLVEAGLLPRVVFTNHDAAYFSVSCAPNTVLCCYGFHWFLDKPAVMRRVRDILRPGGAFVSIEEWPIRVTNGASASQFERQIMENIRPIELAVLYHELEEYGFKLVRFVESEIIPGGMVKINPLHPDMVDEVTYTHQRFHSMFVAVFVKS